MPGVWYRGVDSRTHVPNQVSLYTWSSGVLRRVRTRQGLALCDLVLECRRRHGQCTSSSDSRVSVSAGRGLLWSLDLSCPHSPAAHCPK